MSIVIYTFDPLLKADSNKYSSPTATWGGSTSARAGDKLLPHSLSAEADESYTQLQKDIPMVRTSVPADI
jgi:hypothetical protein